MSEVLEKRILAGCILGVLGGLFGVASCLGSFGMYIIGKTGVIPAEYMGFLVPKHLALPAVGFLFALLGLAGGAACLHEPRAASRLMIISAVGGCGTVLTLYAPATILLLFAAYFCMTPKGKPKWWLI